ncbi:hypothetical protein GCM10012278_53120 [Nonomuraea glycinis]|uniref:Uncharacterized protein n=1 Tax=Nonomuraea glycinis TaxID=2047744 RepID=A0A918E7M7_9ACTN|nr:hypothetical protein GCM10012278_53120 [Nonomuraea glycinis]
MPERGEWPGGQPGRDGAQQQVADPGGHARLGGQPRLPGRRPHDAVGKIPTLIALYGGALFTLVTAPPEIVTRDMVQAIVYGSVREKPDPLSS